MAHLNYVKPLKITWKACNGTITIYSSGNNMSIVNPHSCSSLVQIKGSNPLHRHKCMSRMKQEQSLILENCKCKIRATQMKPNLVVNKH